MYSVITIPNTLLLITLLLFSKLLFGVSDFSYLVKKQASQPVQEYQIKDFSKIR
jgi:hypothetical protein